MRFETENISIEDLELPVKRQNGGTDHLFRITNPPEADAPYYIRIRVYETDRSPFVNAVDSDRVFLKCQCSLTDETGDVMEDSLRGHLLCMGHVHTLNMEAVTEGDLSFDGWLLEMLHKEVEQAAKKAYLNRHWRSRLPKVREGGKASGEEQGEITDP